MYLELLRHREGRQQNIFFEVQYFHPVHNHIRIVNRLGNISEQGLHFAGCFKIKLVVRELKAAIFQMNIVIHEIVVTRGTFLFPGVDAQQNVMCIIVVLVGVMAVICSDYRNVVLL